MAEKKVVQQAKPAQKAPVQPAPKTPVQPAKPAGKK